MIRKVLKRFKMNEKGQGIVEFGLLIALVSAVAIGGLSGVGGKVTDKFNNVVSELGSPNDVNNGPNEDVIDPDVDNNPEEGGSPEGDSIPEGESEEDNLIGVVGSEVDNMIKNNGFIPVADAEELDNVRSPNINTFGKGTIWEGSHRGGLGNKYIQVADIDLGGIESFAPIGDTTYGFKGSFDGRGHTISNLTIKSSKSHVGLFGRAQDITLKNINLVNVDVSGKGSVGGLVGEVTVWDKDSSLIDNCYVTGKVEGKDQHIGGLVGSLNKSTVNNSGSSCQVTGVTDTVNVGGLVGSQHIANIKNSYSTGAVSGGSYVGGLVGDSSSGRRFSSRSEIIKSYSTGNVSGLNDVGGLVGSAKGTDISYSYATGNVDGDAKGGSGGLIGALMRRTKVNESYSTGRVRGTTSGGFLGRSHNGSSVIDSGWANDIFPEGYGDAVQYVKLTNVKGQPKAEIDNLISGLLE